MTPNNKSYPHHDKYGIKHLELHTQHPVIRGVGVRGTLTVFDNFASFVQAVKAPHARNKVVFRSRFFSARVTQDSSFSITCHIGSEEMVDSKIRQKIVQQFVRMMSTLQSLIEQ